MKLQKKLHFTVVLPLFIVATLAAQLIYTLPTHAATLTWTGGAGDHKFSTGANWSGGLAPGSGDVLNFPTWVGPADPGYSNQTTLQNDMASTVFGGLTAGSGPIANNRNYYSIDSLNVINNGTLSAAGDVAISIESLTSTGTVTVDNVVTNTLVANAIIVRNDAVINAATTPRLTVASGSTLITGVNQSNSIYSGVDLLDIQHGASVAICTGSGNTAHAILEADIQFSATGTGNNGQVTAGACYGAVENGVVWTPASGLTINGTVTLAADAKITVNNGYMVMNGQLQANGHSLATQADGGSKILGRGNVGNLSVGANAIVAPGNSPGILNTGNFDLQSGSYYGFELGGTSAGTEYDQINTIGTVTLAGNLQVEYYGGFRPTAGQSFTIINNDGSDPVGGTFNGLAEGAQLVVDGITFSVTYAGGDGNDVVLTVLNASSNPNAPNTGALRLMLANPVVVAGLGILTASFLLFVVIKRRSSKK